MRNKVLFCLLFLLNASTYAQNYDESKVPAYTLPSLLKTKSGKVINSADAWEKKRRPEVLQLFENTIYGQLPKTYDSINYTVTNSQHNAMEGKAQLKEIAITVWRMNQSVIINLVLFVPVKRERPVPVFLLINNRDKTNTDPSRNVKMAFWPAEMVIDSGYAVAAFHVSDAAPDHRDSFQRGVLQLYPEQLGAANGMKAIGAWAWAASRVLDYLERDSIINATQVALVGHSRGGKAALWAGAQDPRFAFVFSNCSGNTGAALARRKFGETIKTINDQFPHWFSDTYKTYNDREAALPVDQHMLLALIAPRPVYVTSASTDLWADPKGSYLALVYAQPVYGLYKKAAPLRPEPPPVNTPIISSFSGYHNREGVHDLTVYDWKQFLRFVAYHLKEK